MIFFRSDYSAGAHPRIYGGACKEQIAEHA